MIGNVPRRSWGRLLLASFLLLIDQAIVQGQTHRWIFCSLEEREPEWITCLKNASGQETCVPTLQAMPEPVGASPTPVGDAVSSPAEYFRLCACDDELYTSDYYCALPTDHCRVPYYGSNNHRLNPSIPKCYRRPTRVQDFAESILPLLIVTCSAMCICVLCSRGGHRFLLLMTTMCLPCLQTAYANYLLRYRPQLASLMVRRWIRRRSARFTERYNQIINDYENNSNPTNDDGGGGRRRHRGLLTNVEETLLRDSIAHSRIRQRPNTLRLRTHVFQESERANNVLDRQRQNSTRDNSRTPENDPEVEAAGMEGDEDLDGCMICFGPLCEGDRVGSLKCRHIFHVVCLKTWYVDVCFVAH
jgi:hypothetical protein